MIDYAVLCNAIENWKAGQKPTSAPPPRRAAPPPAQEQEEEAVEYSAVYDSADLAEARPEEPVESTVIYQLPDEYSEGEVVEEEEQ